MKLKTLILALLLLCLAGCTQPAPEEAAPPEVEPEPIVEELPVEPEAPQTPEPEPLPLPEALPAYLFDGQALDAVVAADGAVILSNDAGDLEVLPDGRTDEIAGVLLRQEEGFQRDEWGNVTPLRQWYDLYDLEGRYECSLPLTWVTAYGNYLYGELPSGSGRVYSRQSGQLLYENVTLFCPVGDHYFLGQGVWGSPGQLLDGEGAWVADTPKDCAVSAPLTADYLLLEQNGLYGLLDETGRVVLDCQYQEIRPLEDGKLRVYDGENYGVLEPLTNTLLFQWPYPIDHAFANTLVVQVDDQYSGAMVMTYSGKPLMGDEFDWISVETQGDNPVLCGAREGNRLYFRADGTVLKELSHTGTAFFLGETRMVCTDTRWDASAQADQCKVQLLDLSTGESTLLAQGSSLRAEPLPETQGYFVLVEDGKFHIFHETGQVVLANLLDYTDRGGVLQATTAEGTGLLRLDGSWLYQIA